MMRNTSKCHFGNETFEPREKLVNDEIQASCTAQCYCREGDEDQSAKFVCAHIDCPEFFGSHTESEMPGKKCVRQYKTNGCCSTGSTCGRLSHLLTHQSVFK